MRYAFVAEHREQFTVRAMCRCLRIRPSGFYAWLKNPLSKRAREDVRQTALLSKAWKESGRVYGYRKLHDDLLDQGETSCPNRIARLARLAGIKAEIGYKRRPGSYGGKPSVAVDNTLARQFDVDAPDRAWVTDITYIRTQEGFAYLAVVIDLFSRRVIGWSLQSRQTTDVVLQALLMAVWRRKPKSKVLVHSDQGSQFTSMDWTAFLKHHNLEHSMIRALWSEGKGTLPDLLHALKNRTKDDLKKWLATSSSARTFADDADRATASVLFMLAKAADLIQFLTIESAKAKPFAFRTFIQELDQQSGARPWIFVPRKEDYFEASKPLLACWLECAASAVRRHRRAIRGTRQSRPRPYACHRAFARGSRRTNRRHSRSSHQIG